MERQMQIPAESPTQEQTLARYKEMHSERAALAVEIGSKVICYRLLIEKVRKMTRGENSVCFLLDQSAGIVEAIRETLK